MKYFYILLVVFTLKASAQDGRKLPSLKIPRVDMPEPDKKPGEQETAPQYSLNKPFEPKLFKVPPKKYDPPQQDTQMQMNQNGSDLNVGKQYAQKLNKQNAPDVEKGVLDPKIFRQHQYFGDFETESEMISLTYRDFGEVDGDRIRIWVDGKIVSEFIELEGNTKMIHLGLLMGINHIEIEALNEGTYTPNTGDFKFFDEQSKIITGDKWGLATGFKAKFNIVRVAKGSLLKK